MWLPNWLRWPWLPILPGPPGRWANKSHSPGPLKLGWRSHNAPHLLTPARNPTRRHSCYGFIRRNVPDNCRTCSYDCSTSNLDVLTDHGACADVCAPAELHSSRQARPGGYVDVISNAAVMVQYGARIQDHIIAQFHAGIDDHTCHDR